MAELKAERHHWWPQGVSKFWLNSEGCVHWLQPNGEVVTSPPKNFGRIGNGHHILMGKSGEPTVWDSCFESEFQLADDNFPAVIRWLERLDRTSYPAGTGPNNRFNPVEIADTELAMLVEGLISLAVRSPMNRESAVGLAERLRGSLPERERNTIISMNLQNTHHDAVKQIGIRGKFVAIYSPDKEFIFGDGFYHNIQSPVISTMFSPTILAPLTPRIAVLFVKPSSYTTKPRFFTLVVDADEAKFLNDTVQVYSRDKIFYRSERPEIEDAYSQGKHLKYSGPSNPIDSFIHLIPGVPPRRNWP